MCAPNLFFPRRTTSGAAIRCVYRRGRRTSVKRAATSFCDLLPRKVNASHNNPVDLGWYSLHTNFSLYSDAASRIIAKQQLERVAISEEKNLEILIERLISLREIKQFAFPAPYTNARAQISALALRNKYPFTRETASIAAIIYPLDSSALQLHKSLHCANNALARMSIARIRVYVYVRCTMNRLYIALE